MGHKIYISPQISRIGVNTYPNMMGILAGLHVERKYACTKNRDHPNLDECPLIWKNFSEAKYLTGMIEDAPFDGNFNYNKTGKGGKFYQIICFECTNFYGILKI